MNLCNNGFDNTQVEHILTRCFRTEILGMVKVSNDQHQSHDELKRLKSFLTNIIGSQLTLCVDEVIFEEVSVVLKLVQGPGDHNLPDAMVEIVEQVKTIAAAEGPR